MLLAIALSACTEAGVEMPGGVAPAVAPAAPVPAAPAAVPSVTQAGAASPTARPPRMAEPPGFVDLGPVTGPGPGPIYLTLTLNINDFLRPEREAKAVREWLTLTESIGAATVELSVTGEVLDALARVDPGLDGLVRTRKPTLSEHLRVLEYRKLDDADHQLFHLDLTSLALDRARPGPLVAIQQRFGVTPRDGGGVLADALRAGWVPGPISGPLKAAGLAKVDKGETIVHPNTVVAAILAAAPSHTLGHEGIDAWARTYRVARARCAGARTTDVDAAIIDLGYQVHAAMLQGWDVFAMPAVTTLVDPKRLGGFLARPERWVPSEAEAAAIRARPDARAALDAAFDALSAGTCSALTAEDELGLRLAALDPTHAWAGRVSWHATDDYSVEPWSQNLYGPHWGPEKLVPAATRPDAEQRRIQEGHAAMYRAMAANPRVHFVSVDNDTQWAPQNAPAAGWKQVFGVDLAAFPAGFDAAALEAAAAAKGFVAPPDEAPRGGGRRRPGGGRR